MTRRARPDRGFAPRSSRRSRLRGVAASALLATLCVAASPARADDYDPKRAGHPLRVFAYLAHPIGVVLDYALFRPAHWIVEIEPLKTIFGHTD
jgi:hypothetical protein